MISSCVLGLLCLYASHTILTAFMSLTARGTSLRACNYRTGRLQRHGSLQSVRVQQNGGTHIVSLI